MDGIGGQNENNAIQGIGSDSHFQGVGDGFVALLNSFMEVSPLMATDGMTGAGQLGLNPYHENDKIGSSQNNEGIGTLVVSSQSSTDAATSSDYAPDLKAERASDLLIAVSLSSESTWERIADLAYSSLEELTKVAFAGTPLWQLHQDGKYETINDVEYLSQFGHVDKTLMELMKMVEVGEPLCLPSFDSNRIEDDPMLPEATAGETFQIEASRDIAYVKMNPVSLVGLLMDVKQWSGVFYNIVAGAMILGIMPNGEEAGYDGKLQVMSSEYHLPTPLVPSRGCYFVRHCKQLSHNMWAVVDVSLDKFFPNPTTNFRRRPSGCLIQEMADGYSKVIWVEHVEADYTGLNAGFQGLVSSGFAFCAKRWVASLVRHCEWSEALLQASSTPPADGEFISQAGRTSVLKLADRMMRNFCVDISGYTANQWMQLVCDSEDVRLMIKESIEDSGKPPGTTLVFATSLWLPVSPSSLFNFLRDHNSRYKWDILARGYSIQERAYLVKGKDPRNRVSILQFQDPTGDIKINYLQDCHADKTGSYVIYAPIDLPATSALVNGTVNPDNVAVLASGLAILPDRAPESDDEDSATASFLTVAFHIIDNESSKEHIPPRSLETIQRIMKETVASVKEAAVLHNGWME